MFRKLGKMLFVAVLSCTVLIALSAGLVGCKKVKNKTDEEQPLYGLVADFENFDEVRTYDFDRKFGAASINTDTQYITSGSGSLKVTDTRDTAKLTVPLKDDSMQKDYTDTSKLQHIELDLFNASQEKYTVFVSLLYKDGLVASDKQKIELQPNQWTNFSWKVNVKKLAVSTDLDDATGFLINFEPNSGKDKTVYVDRLQFYYNETAAQLFDISLDAGEFCSFEKEYQEYTVYSSGYAHCEDFLPITSINTDAQYVKEGQKSLKVVCPSGVKNRYPYVAFSPKLLEVADLSQYDGNSALSFWVYNAQASDFYLIVDFFRTGSYVQRGFHYMIKPGWTNLVLTFSEINKEDGGVDVLTDNLEQFRLVYNSFEATETLTEKVLYFDDFKILSGEQVYADMVLPSANALYDLEDAEKREKLSASAADYFSTNHGTVRIGNEDAVETDGYSIQITGLGEVDNNKKTWVTVKLENLTRLIDYIQAKDAYKNYNMLTMQMKVDAGIALVCGFDGYFAFGTTVQQVRADANGWATVSVPVSEISKNEINLYCSAGVNTLYIDDVKLARGYTITWKHDDGTTLATSVALSGQVPAYTGATPTKAGSQGVEYMFAGWTPALVPAEANATYTTQFITRYTPVDQTLYRWEEYDVGTDVIGEFTSDVYPKPKAAVIDANTVASAGGKSAKVSYARGERYIYFTNLTAYIEQAKTYYPQAKYLQLKMRVQSELDGEGRGAIVTFGAWNYTLFGKNGGDNDVIRVRQSDTDWTTVTVALTDVTQNYIHCSVGYIDCDLYIDDVQLISEYTEDITELFTFSKTQGGGIYLNYANNPDIFGKVYQSGTTFSYTTSCVDISKYAGKTLRIMLPYSSTYGLAFSTVNNVWQKETKQDGWYYVNSDATAESGKIVDIVIPAGAKFVKTTDWLGSYRTAHPEVLNFSAMIVY